jgi:hypothetical protein
MWDEITIPIRSAAAAGLDLSGMERLGNKFSTQLCQQSRQSSIPAPTANFSRLQRLLSEMFKFFISLAPTLKY